MKTAENKQKAIELAYGENWDNVSQFIDDNGWLKSHEISPFDLKLTWNDIQVEEYEKGGSIKYRPKSLSGIEDNNGWISINSEDDLLKQDGYYFGLTINGDIVVLRSNNNKWVIENDETTHYQPIEKPLKPIY